MAWWSAQSVLVAVVWVQIPLIALWFMKKLWVDRPKTFTSTLLASVLKRLKSYQPSVLHDFVIYRRFASFCVITHGQGCSFPSQWQHPLPLISFPAKFLENKLFPLKFISSLSHHHQKTKSLTFMGRYFSKCSMNSKQNYSSKQRQAGHKQNQSRFPCIRF